MFLERRYEETCMFCLLCLVAVAASRHVEMVLCYVDMQDGSAICWNKGWFELFGGLLTCLMPCVYPTDMFDREYPDMIWHVWCRECF